MPKIHTNDLPIFCTTYNLRMSIGCLEPLVMSCCAETVNFLKGSLSTHDFETRTASGSKLFSLITRLHTMTFTMLSMFSRLWMISIKIWETPLSWHTECSLPVAVRVSKTRVLKLPITF